MGEGERPGGGVVQVLRSAGTVVGMEFVNVASGATAFQGSPPIPGKVLLTGLFVVVPSASAASFHRFQVAVASEVPSSQAEIDAEDQMFPYANSVVGQRSSFAYYYAITPAMVVVSRVLEMNGRRIVGGFYNGATGARSAYIGFCLQGLVGGEPHGAAAMLSGDWLEER